MTVLAQFTELQATQKAARTITTFLAECQHLLNLKNMIIDTICRCKKMQTRGKMIYCMNKIRMSILRQMW